ncbi:MAG TPA: HD domain-containing protein [Solirubrobacteraceae bacterium]
MKTLSSRRVLTGRISRVIASRNVYGQLNSSTPPTASGGGNSRYQGQRLRALWEKFEAHKTPEARFAKAMDRLQPLLNNYFTKGSTWREVGVTEEQVIAINQPIGLSSPQLWAYAQELIKDAVRQGFLRPANTDPQ